MAARATSGLKGRTWSAWGAGLRRICDRNETHVRSTRRAPEGIDAGGEYLGVMHRDNLKIIAAGRRRRLGDSAPPKLDLTAEEIERSTGTAMRLADASRTQAEARASADTTRPT
jgi:hypothetical protein